MYWSLFISFFKIGAFTFGGGYAMIPLIEREVISRREWLSEDEFQSLFTLAQSAPGPIAVNTAVFIGYKLRGVSGALTTLLGVVLPSFVAILVLAHFFSLFRNNLVVDSAFRAMRPAVVALIVWPIVGFSKGMNLLRIIAAVAVAVLIWHFGVSAVLLLLSGALVGLVSAWFTARKEVEK